MRITSGSLSQTCITGTRGYVTLDGFEITGCKVGIKIQREAAGGWVIKNSLIFGNSQDGIEIRAADNTLMQNCVIYGNGSSSRGLFVSRYALNTTLRQSTVYNHKYNVYFASSAGGEIRNSIINSGFAGVYAKSAKVSVIRSTVYGHSTNYLYAAPGAGSVSLDPVFVAPARGDFRPLAGAPDGIQMGYRAVVY